MRLDPGPSLAIALLVCTATLARAANYSVALVGIGPGQSPAVAMGINASGQVTGFSAGDLMRAFVFQNGLGNSLGPLGGTASLAYAINNGGAVAGYVRSPGNVNEDGFVYSGGQTADVASSDGSIALSAINASGQAVGVQYSSDGIIPQALIWANGSVLYIGTLPGAAGSNAFGINDAGQVVGETYLAGGYNYHAFLYSQDVMIDMGTLGGPLSSAAAINNAGQIAGWANVAYYGHGMNASLPDTHAFLDSNGIMTDLGTLGGDNSEADALNNLGPVVGYSEIVPGKPGQSPLR